MKLRENYTCPLEIVHDIIKGKWKPILNMSEHDMPFGGKAIPTKK